MPADRVSAATTAWAQAASVHGHLLHGGRLTPIASPVPGLIPEDGEYAVALFDAGLNFARWCDAPASTGGRRPMLVVGSRQFLTGYLLGGLFARSRARRQVVAQWRPARLLTTVLTTRRLWCEIGSGAGQCAWLHFNHDTIASLDLAEDALTLRFDASEPLRLTGDWAPWCAAVIAYYRYGAHAPSAVPSLHAAAIAG